MTADSLNKLAIVAGKQRCVAIKPGYHFVMLM